MNIKLIHIELIKKLDKILVLDNIKNDNIFVAAEHTDTEIESVTFHGSLNHSPYDKDFFSLEISLHASKSMILRVYDNLSLTYFPDSNCFKFIIEHEPVWILNNQETDYMFNVTVQYGIDNQTLKTIIKWYKIFSTYIDNMKGVLLS